MSDILHILKSTAAGRARLDAFENPAQSSLAPASGSGAWIDAAERMPQGADFPCWGYWGLAAHSRNYDFRGPALMRDMFNDTLTNWMPLDLNALPVPQPPNC